MLYSKPKDVKYVDMCIWIDENAYKEDLDEEKMFQYLYLISEMLAYKARYFEKSDDYDNFGIFMASKLFMRYKSSNPKVDKIVSVLNYTKRVLYPYKVQYQQQEYKENVYSQDEEGQEVNVIDNSFRLGLSDEVHLLNKVDFEFYLANIDKTVRYILDQTHEKRESNLYRCLYISCLLSLIKEFTPTSHQQEHIESIVKCQDVQDNLYEKIYSQLSDQIVLYHLPACYKNYVLLLVRKVKKVAKEELSYILSSQFVYDDVINKDVFGEGRQKNEFAIDE